MQSVATIDAPQFINIEPYNPLISKCEVKVLYLGKNRNRSLIDKNTAIQMANSLPGTPIVAAYSEDKKDFGDHGDKIIIEDGEIKFSCKTVPYGFISPDSKVWFQNFEEKDDFGEVTIREYLMATGYLWTGQYEETESILKDGKGQSMELDPETLQGHWATESNSNVEFFIINDAIFSKLCILGDDVQPCFEGASVTAPNVSKNFSQDESFAKTLHSMMGELKYALNKGGSDMEDLVNEPISTEEPVESAGEDFVCAPNGDKKKKYEDKKDKKDDEDMTDEDPKDPDNSEDAEEKKPATKNTVESEEVSADTLQEELNALRSNYAQLEQEISDLRKFKLTVEDKEKDAKIAEFFMLSPEDKKDVIDHKSDYTLEQIEEKLSVICVRNKVSFAADDSEQKTAKEDPIATFNLDGAAEPVPGWVSALRAVV